MNPPSGSPFDGRYTVGLQRNGIVAQVSAIKAESGAVVIDCFEPVANGGSWTNVPVLSMVAFDDAAEISPVQSPPRGRKAMQADTSAPRAVLFFLDYMRNPVCVGFLRKSGSKPITADPSDGPENAEDKAVTPRLQERGTFYAGASITIDAHGNVTVDAQAAEQGVFRAQLPSGRPFRVSWGGAAEERGVLGKRLLTYIQAMEARIEYLTARLMVVESTLNIVPPNGPSAPSIAESAILSAALHLPDAGEGD